MGFLERRGRPDPRHELIISLHDTQGIAGAVNTSYRVSNVLDRASCDMMPHSKCCMDRMPPTCIITQPQPC